MIEAGRPPQYVGARVLRVEDPSFLRGRARYIDDITRPGMTYVAFARSPHAHARIKAIDPEQARALEGVVAVMTGADLQDAAKPIVSLIPARPDVRAVTHPFLPADKVRHVGEAFAVVVAESRYIAEDAVDLIETEWEPLPSVVHAEEALKPGAPLLHEEFEDNNIAHMESVHGDVDAAFAQADHVFSTRFQGGRYMAAPLEMRGIVADYDAATDETVIWTSTQIPHFHRTLVAPLLGIPEAKLRVIAPAVGGAFGLKCSIYPEDVVLPVLTRLVGRPVKWIEDRYEHLAASGHAKEIICYIDIAVQNDGTFLAFRGRYITDAGAYSVMPWTALIDALPSGPLLPSIYDVRNVHWAIDAAMTNKCHATPYRAVGITPGHNAREILIDEIARALGIDPVDLRLKNCIPSEPYTTATGQHYEGGSYAECIRKTLDVLDYPALREKQRRLREEGRYLGIGISPFIEPTAFGSQIAQSTGMTWQEASFDLARVTVEPDGSVTVATGQSSHGQGHATTFAQVAADALGVRIEDVVVKGGGDTARAPYGMGTWGSRSGVIGAGGIIRAGREVREKLVRMAAQAMEVSPEDIELSNSVASVKGVPDKSMTVGEIAMFAYFAGANRPADIEEPFLGSSRSYDPPEAYTNGCIVAVVEVDVETGLVDVQRLVAVEDCGVMMNPMVVEGQIMGAVAQGVGGALYEELRYDENGQFLAGSFMDYLLPSTTEVPLIEIGHFESPGLTEGGIKGAGEGGMVAAPAALLTAVADALSPFGVTVTKSPLGPNDILALIREAKRKESGD